MKKNFSQECAIACQFIPFVNREDFIKEFIIKSKKEELSKECREFLSLCCENEEEFYNELNRKRIPEKLKKFTK